MCRFRRIYNALGENSLADNFLWKWEIHFKWMMCVSFPLTKELKLCQPRQKKFGQSEIFSYKLYAARAVNFGKSNHEIELIGNWFLWQFSSNTCFFFGWGSLNFPIIGDRKKRFSNANLRGCKTKKKVKGFFFHRRYRLKIFVFINAMIFAFTTFVKNTPLRGKRRF